MRLNEAQQFYFVPIKPLRLHNIMTGTRVPKRIVLGQRFAGVLNTGDSRLNAGIAQPGRQEGFESAEVIHVCG